MQAEIVLMAKQGIDGVYSADPKSDPDAKRYSQLSYEEALVKNLRVMDQTALALCRENQLPIVVFNMEEVGNLQKLAAGKAVGTRVEG
jgi:uridylate kinase